MELGRILEPQELWIKMEIASMLVLFNKLKSNFQINQPLGMNHRIDGWISGARKPGQAEE